MSIDLSVVFPDTIPDDMIATALATWPEAEVESELWWKHGHAMFEYPARNRAWLREEVGRVPIGGFGHLRSEVTGLWGQCARIGTGTVIELGGSGGDPEQVRRSGTSGNDGRTLLLDGVDRVDGRRVLARAGHGWVLKTSEAASIMWAWCSESRIRGTHTKAPVL